MITSEHTWADEYVDEVLRSYIREEYNKRHSPAPTPASHPQNYDPLDPPNEWRYDPYYEIWINV
jgi:hypothetical protein